MLIPSLPAQVVGVVLEALGDRVPEIRSITGAILAGSVGELCGG